MQILKDHSTILQGKSDLLVIRCSTLIEKVSPLQNLNEDTLEVSPADAKTNFEKGFTYAKSYAFQGDYLLIKALSDNSDLNACSSMCVLNKTTPQFYSASFKDIDINSLKALLLQCNTKMSLFEKLSLTSNPAFMFTAGFILSASRRFNLVLSGGIEMIAILLIANKIASRDAIHHDHRHIHWCTTENLIHQNKEALDSLINELDYRLKAYYVKSNKLEALK